MPLAAPAMTALAQKPDYISDEEEDKIREAQEPSERIELYLTLAQSRLDRIEGFRSKPMDPQYDNGAYIDHLLDEYISLTDELKNWIQYQYDHRGDMRKGLRKVLEMGPNDWVKEPLSRWRFGGEAYPASSQKEVEGCTDFWWVLMYPKISLLLPGSIPKERNLFPDPVRWIPMGLVIFLKRSDLIAKIFQRSW